MKIIKYEEMSTEKLNKNKNIMKTLLIVIIMAWIFMIGLLIYIYPKRGSVASFYPFLVQVFALPVILIPLYQQIKKISNELISRDEKKL